jgi:hypothetical protein
MFKSYLSVASAIMMLCLSVIKAPAQEARLYKGKGYKGCIFDSCQFLLMATEDRSHRFTPTMDEIKKSEKLLKGKLKIINNHHANQYGNCPNIETHLKKYFRQYAGYIKNGEKVILMNMIWPEKGIKDKAKKQWISNYDGCSHYWNILVNIDSGELSQLNINGNS